jgi:hypothetical protein
MSRSWKNGRSLREREAGSSAAPRNDRKKGKCNGKDNSKSKHRFPPGMTNKRGMLLAEAFADFGAAEVEEEDEGEEALDDVGADVGAVEAVEVAGGHEEASGGDD